jgi:hypothetical protein
MSQTGLDGQEFPRCLIINGQMSCGSRFPPKPKRSFPILGAVMLVSEGQMSDFNGAAPSRIAGSTKSQLCGGGFEMLLDRGTGAV